MKTTVGKMILTAIIIASVGVTSLPVSAHEYSNAIKIKTSDSVIQGTLEDGTPYTLSIIAPGDANINIIDSKYYSFKATFSWGENPPETMYVVIPMKGGTYRGTLKRIGSPIKDLYSLSVYAYYGGTIIGVI